MNEHETDMNVRKLEGNWSGAVGDMMGRAKVKVRTKFGCDRKGARVNSFLLQ